MTFLYLDPGSGSLILQALIAGILGIGMFFKRIKLKILSLFNPQKSDDEPDNH
jgi:phosphoglycerate-specific signal transduction histidine kinase